MTLLDLTHIFTDDMDEQFPVHKILLKNNVLIIENLTNLHALESVSEFIVRAQPMKYHSDAAPSRVYAQIID